MSLIVLGWQTNFLMITFAIQLCGNESDDFTAWCLGRETSVLAGECRRLWSWVFSRRTIPGVNVAKMCLRCLHVGCDGVGPFTVLSPSPGSANALTFSSIKCWRDHALFYRVLTPKLPSLPSADGPTSSSTKCWRPNILHYRVLTASRPRLPVADGLRPLSTKCWRPHALVYPVLTDQCWPPQRIVRYLRVHWYRRRRTSLDLALDAWQR